MPKIHAKFSIDWTYEDSDVPDLWVKGTMIRTGNRDLFDRLKVVAESFFDSEDYANAKIRIPYPSDAFDAIRETLVRLDVGLLEPGPVTVQKEGELFPHYWRSFNHSELDDFPYFTFGDGGDTIADYHSRDAEERLTIDPGTVRGALDFGILQPYAAIALSSRLKKAIEALEPVGGLFREIPDTEGIPSGLWQLWSDVVLPECRVPRIDSLYQPVVDKNVAGFFHDGGYYPALLKFDCNEVEALGTFDVAVMQERFGPFGKNSDREVVISNRIRKGIEKLDIPDMSFHPVELV